MVKKKISEELPSGWMEKVNVNNGKTVYIEKSTGHKFYSRPQVARYLGKVNPDSSSVKENDDVNAHITGELTKFEHSESVEDKCHISGEKNTPGNPFLEVKENTNELDGIPHGWIKELRTRKYKDGFKQDPYYTDPVSGYVFRSKKDVLRYLETGDIRKCKTKPQKRDLTELKSLGVLTSPLPDNVKKEEYSASISQLSAADMPGKDVPDIAGGCEIIFPPAEGDISKEKEADCLPFDSAFRTSTVDAEEKLQYAEAVDSHKSEKNSMSRSEGFKQDLKLVDGNEVSTPTLTAHSRKSKRKPLSVPRRSSKRLADHGPRVTPYSNLNERTLHAAAIKDEVNGSSCLSSEVAISEEAQQLDTDLKAASEYRTSSYTEGSPDSNVQVTTGARDANSLSNKEVANEVPQQLDTDIYNEPSPDINVHASIIPGNINCVSNNAAVSEVPQQLDSNLYFEASLDTDLHATIDSGYEQSGAINAAVSEVPLQNLDTVIESGVSALSQSRINMDLNCTLESCFQDMDVQQQTLVQGYESQKGLDPRFQGDYWSDPCFDFAFKTLAGGMPFEETMELDSCFQPQTEPSYTQEGGVSFVVPDMNAPAFFQNDETYKLDSVPASISMDQLPPANLTSLPVKASLPGCSTSESQPPSLEGRSKECQAKANSQVGKVLFW